MDANLNFLTATAPNTLNIGDSAPPSGPRSIGRNPMLGKEFANLMRSMLPDAQRQDLAAGGSTASQNGLQSLSLGNKFALITADAPQPDANSLAAFARAQGLTDGAVQALFGDLSDLKSPSSTLIGIDGLDPRGGKNADKDAATAVDLNSSADAPVLAPPMTPSWFASAQQAEGLSRIDPSSPDSLAKTLLIEAAAAKPVLGQNLSNLPPETDPQASVSPNTLASLLAASGASATLKQLGAAPDLQPAAAETAPEPGPLDVMRMRFMPAWENMTRQLAKAAGSDQAQPWANLVDGLLSGKSGALPELEIDLSGANIGSATDTGNGLGTVSATFNNDNRAQIVHSGQSTPSLTLSEKSPAEALAASGPNRAEQIAQLADKLGQALSERLQQQIEQGQWKLELRLKPAHLGKISVELDMNAGGLDALFKSDNPLTRELLAQGSARLRDNLAQAGMTVANVWVNSDGQQKTGGNPTPRQTPELSSIAKTESSQETVLKIEAPRAKSAEGWDEMV